MLGLVVTDHLFRTYRDLPEGELAKVRASVVNSAALAEVAAELDLGAALLLGKGEDPSGGREKPSILADAMEAVIGAVYIDGGWDGGRRAGHAPAAQPLKLSDEIIVGERVPGTVQVGQMRGLLRRHEEAPGLTPGAGAQRARELERHQRAHAVAEERERAVERRQRVGERVHQRSDPPIGGFGVPLLSSGKVYRADGDAVHPRASPPAKRRAPPPA